MSDNRTLKAMLINGSVHEHGCTDRGIREVAEALESQGVKADIFWLGTGPIADSLVVHERDIADELSEIAPEYDAFVVGSPVYFGNANGRIVSFMNRFFYGRGDIFRGKVGAALGSCRRTGGMTTAENLRRWMDLDCMIVPTSYYWNEIHGQVPADVEEDREGLVNLRQLGNMIAYCVKLIDLGRKNGIEPVYEKRERTNFIRRDRNDG